MSCTRANIAGLVLLALVGGAASRPSQNEVAVESSTLLNHSVFTTCPLIVNRIATPQEVSGSWYIWELLKRGEAPVRQTPCVRYVFGTDGDLLTLRIDLIREGGVVQTRNFTYIPETNGMWEPVGEVVTNAYFLGFGSDERLLLLCYGSIIDEGEDAELSMVMGQAAVVDDAAMTAARRPNATGLTSVRPDLYECAPPAGRN